MKRIGNVILFIMSICISVSMVVVSLKSIIYTVTLNELSYYSQRNGSWSNMPYGNCDSYQTFGSAGCGSASLAMIISYLKGIKVTPTEIAENAIEAGYIDCSNGSYEEITELASYYDLIVSDHGKSSIDEISNLVRHGSMIHILGRKNGEPFSSDGHFIVIRGITDNDRWLIFDSGHLQNSMIEWDPMEIYPYITGNVRSVSKTESGS